MNQNEKEIDQLIEETLISKPILITSEDDLAGAAYHGKSALIVEYDVDEYSSLYKAYIKEMDEVTWLVRSDFKLI
ncbi:hypothetical protein [Halobacillus sp. A5]|uniref:hypothetical protein n=1 Tax=Halobacillus sp. A5 TaxID=2880263 RepID=UPI0020A64855|nr:hypothetical protein [Halobacillus sp. A5]MCP3025397.1 hypothetical protein [Halobacillus sp. A5]